MESYGSYETGREIFSGGRVTVHTARKQGESAELFAVKVFSLSVSPDDQFGFGDPPPSFAGECDAFVRAVELQKQAAASSPHVAPILESGRDERGAWYVTRLYPRSIQKITEGRVALSREGLFHILYSTLLGLLEMKKACGRSHGNLKPSNVLIGGGERIRDAQVVLADPAPLPGDPARCELADLHAVGLLLYQVVRRREVSDASDWLILPIETSKEWTELFGASAGAWLAICNGLLDRNLSLDNYNLEKLEADLAARAPKPPIPPRLLALVVAILIVAGVGAWLILRLNNKGVIEVSLDPPDATLITDGKPLATSPRSGRERKLQLPEGQYKLVAHYRDLEPVTNVVRVEKQAPQSAAFRLAYGQLVVDSNPRGAGFALGGLKATTPYTNPYARPGAVEFKMNLAGHQEAFLQGAVATNQTVLLFTNLIAVEPGAVPVEVSSRPLGADVVITGERGNKLTLKCNGFPQLTPGRYTITATFQDWTQQLTQIFQLAEGTRTTNVPRFDFAFGTLVLSSEPEGAKVTVEGKFTCRTPTNVYWPPGNVRLRFEADGYVESNLPPFVLQESDRLMKRVTLAPQVGFALLVSDLPANLSATVSIFSNNVPQRVLEVDKPARIELLPGSYSLRSKFEGLEEVINNVALEKGQMKTVSIAFAFGRVRLDSDPRGAELINPLSNKVTSLEILPEGKRSLTARHPDYPLLEPETLELDIRKGEIRTNTFRFKYTTVIVTSTPAGADVLISGQSLGPTPLTNYYVPFGDRVFFLVSNGRTNPQPIRISQWTNYLIGTDFTVPEAYTNTLGMEFEFRREVTSYVSRYEVTEANYMAVMAMNRGQTNLDLPAVNIGWTNALKFFDRLNQQYGGELQASLRDGTRYIYAMPTETEWRAFAGSASLNDTNIVLKPSLTAQPVHRRPSPARTGLFDLYGNVAEWCEGFGADRMIALGGSFNNSRSVPSRTNFFRLSQRQLEAGAEQSPIAVGAETIGLRPVFRRKQ